MGTDSVDRKKSFVIGVVLPLSPAILAVPYLTGKKTTSPRGWHPFNPVESFGWGLFYLGLALRTHALSFRSYENHRLAKHAILVAAAVAFTVGLGLRF